MRIILTYHAKKENESKKYKIKDIEDNVELPDYIISKDNKKHSYKKMNNKILKVVYSKEDKYIKIITLIWK